MTKYIAFLCLAGVLTLSSSAQEFRADSLRQRVEKLPNDTVKVNTLILLAEELSGTAPDEAIAKAETALDLAQKLRYTKGVANAYKFIGLGYYNQNDYVEATLNYQESIKSFEEIGDKVGVSNILNNLGTIYSDQGDDEKALELYLQSLSIAEEVDDKLRICTVSLNIGLIYQKKASTLDKAEEYYGLALKIAEEIDYTIGIGYSSVNLGEVYLDQDKDSLALAYFEKSSVALENSMAMPYVLINTGKVYLKRRDFISARRVLKRAYDLSESTGNKLFMSMALMEEAETWVALDNKKAAIETFQRALMLAEEIGAKESQRDAYEQLANHSAELQDFKSAYLYQRSLTAVKDSLFQSANEKRLNLMLTTHNLENKEKEIKVQELTIQKQRLIKNASIAGLLMILIIAFIILRNYLQKAKINKILDRQNEEIETLLLNILPETVAKELQENGKSAPKEYESVSVLFTDFKGFSTIAESLSPNVLVEELSSFFIAFDAITGKHGLEKIKTIGDAYMCAGGIPVSNETHPIDAVKAGLEMQEFMIVHNKKRAAEGKIPWDLRVGIHTGPIVAGVVGKKKYAYDIWGSTVNIASRMESNGEAGKVNISQSTYQLISEQFECVHRGKISAKNVGEIDMYFVNT
jgi:adenylate cyclase